MCGAFVAAVAVATAFFVGLFVVFRAFQSKQNALHFFMNPFELLATNKRISNEQQLQPIIRLSCMHNIYTLPNGLYLSACSVNFDPLSAITVFYQRRFAILDILHSVVLPANDEQIRATNSPSFIRSPISLSLFSRIKY